MSDFKCMIWSSALFTLGVWLIVLGIVSLAGVDLTLNTFLFCFWVAGGAFTCLQALLMLVKMQFAK